jgi:flagellar biosynthetic protein FliP
VKVSYFLLLITILLGGFGLPLTSLVAQDEAGGDGGGITVGDIEVPSSSFFKSEDLPLAIKIVLIMSVLTLLPAIMLTMTSFTRIMIILSFVKRAMGTQDLPPHQIVVGFSLFLTLAIMAPIFAKINSEAFEPYQEEKLTLVEAGARAADVMGAWLLKQTRPDDIKLMVHVARAEPPARPEDTPLYLLIPAFALSELKTAFQMGFIIFLPFLIIDIVIASILLSMGMFMLPPIIISTPFKIILFVLVDGWTLVISSLVRSFGF